MGQGMTIPSISLALHDRYTPKIRDRILDKLRTSADQSAYAILSPELLRALAVVESPDAPVLSLYLELSPARRARGAWQSAFSSLAASTLKGIGHRDERKLVDNELDRIETSLHEELPALGRGVAIFSCEPIGLWRQVAVSIPMPDAAFLSDRAYVRPLARTRDEHDRFVLVLLSQEHSRFFISQIGQVEEVFQVKGQRVPRKQAERMAHNRSHVVATEPVRHEAQVLSHVATLIMRQFEGRYLLISGVAELRAPVVQDLPKEMQQHIGADFAANIHVGLIELAAAAEPAQRAIEEREELRTVQRLLDGSPRWAVWGVGPCLDALGARQVMTLAVDDTFSQPGAQCGNCGGLWAKESRSCPTCGSDAIGPVGDVVELALERALEQKAALELVRSHAALELMKQRGPMAAMLR
jgi:peptide subunit release factor 1 (eRF1)